MARLKSMLSKNHVAIHSVLGNHEHWLSHPGAQAHFKEKLGLAPDSPKLQFSRQFYDPHLQLLVVHDDCGVAQQTGIWKRWPKLPGLDYSRG